MAADWYWADGLALQADGKIITVGISYYISSTTNGSMVCTVARFSSRGAIDATFGVGGTVATQLARPGVLDPDTSCDAVALQQDGKFVIAAGAPDLGVGVIRLNADGSRDVTFGKGGEVVVPTRYSGGTAKGIVVQADGKIIVGGYSSFYIPIGKPSDATGYWLGQFMLARFDTTGALDTTFGQGGIVLRPAADPMFQLSAMALQPDGKHHRRDPRWRSAALPGERRSRRWIRHWRHDSQHLGLKCCVAVERQDRHRGSGPFQRQHATLLRMAVGSGRPLGLWVRNWGKRFDCDWRHLLCVGKNIPQQESGSRDGACRRHPSPISSRRRLQKEIGCAVDFARSAGDRGEKRAPDRRVGRSGANSIRREFDRAASSLRREFDQARGSPRPLTLIVGPGA